MITNSKTLLAYADKISIQPGEKIGFKVSAEDSLPYEAKIVRLIHADTNPVGPGYKEIEVPDAAWSIQGRRQPVFPGSCAVVLPCPQLHDCKRLNLRLLLWPTLPEQPDQVLVSCWNPQRALGFVLKLDGPAGLTLQLGDGKGACAAFSLNLPMLARHWYDVRAEYDAPANRVRLSQISLRRYAAPRDHGDACFPLGPTRLGPSTANLVFAARPATAPRPYEAFFNGKLEAPLLEADGEIVGNWNFANGMHGETLDDTSANEYHAHTHQGPARGVTGHNWDGTAFNCWQSPTQYGAVHFHHDDLQDAGWATDFTYTPPPDLPSGLYAARLRSATGEDYVPFVVRPKHPTARLALIVPTASYLAYANEHLAIDAALAERVHDHVPAFGPNDLHLAAHRELGGSLYDVHDDGSGIMTSSRHRPILNMRPKYQSWLGGGTVSALWQMAADTHIIDFLHQRGIACDCITDEDLHTQGADLLAPYTCIMTGTHAEYWSTAMLDALCAYRDKGGRIMHMGANGLYWRIAFHPQRPGIIEVRRTEVGNGWITPPGEGAHAFTGEQGGLWRRLGRPPQSIVGVGFVGQGFDISSYYRRLPDSYDPRAAFIFANVPEDVIGDFRLIGGGAAGLELDRADKGLGTPPNALILARSENHTRNYLPTVEDLLINYAGQADLRSVCAEMLFFETAAGGAVFATGSIAWSGSLSHNSYDNTIARITHNVLTRFIDPTPFPTTHEKEKP